MAIRDEFGRRILQFTGATINGTTNVAHGFSDHTTELDYFTSVVIGVDGSVVENGNIMGITNSEYNCNLDATNFVITSTGTETNVLNQTCIIYCTLRPNK
jgi:hypothetical protein